MAVFDFEKLTNKHVGYVYETFGISKQFPVKLQLLYIRAEQLDNPLTAIFYYNIMVFFFLISNHPGFQ